MWCLALAVVLAIPGGFAHADPYAFFFALDRDLETLRSAGQPVGEPSRVGSRAIHRVRVGAHTVYAVKMGSGPVETAISAQALLSRTRVAAAFSTGPVGSLAESLVVGQWVRVVEAKPYQAGSWTGEGFQAAEKAGLRFDNAGGIAEFIPEVWRGVKPVAVASGEMFVASEIQRTILRETTGADAVEMNLFGLGRACADHGVPLLVFRVVSDRADGNAAPDFAAFVEAYGGKGGDLVAEWVKALPADERSGGAYPEIRKAVEGLQ